MVEAELIRVIQTGDKAASDGAFTSLLKLYEPTIQAIARDRSSRHVNADDLAQIGRLALHRAAKAFKAGNFRAYARLTIRRAVIDTIREEIGFTKTTRYQNALKGESSQMIEYEAAPPDATVEEADWCQWASGKLMPYMNERERQIWAKLCEGCSQVEAAESLGIARHTVEYLIRYLRSVVKNIKGESGRSRFDKTDQ